VGPNTGEHTFSVCGHPGFLPLCMNSWPFTAMLANAMVSRSTAIWVFSACALILAIPMDYV